MKAEKYLKDLAQTYQGIDLSQAQHVLSSNIDARTILAQKTVHEELMKGEVIQVRNVSLNDKGLPRHFFGFSLFHLDRQADSTKPVLRISSMSPTINPTQIDQAKALTLMAKPGYTDEIQKALSKATGSIAADFMEEIKEIAGVMSQPIAPIAKAIELKRSLANIADWYFESDAQKRKDFLTKTGSLFTITYQQGVRVQNLQGERDGVLAQIHQIPLSEFPTNHRGVPINERQVKKLLCGYSITVVPESGTEAEGAPIAQVKFNPIVGKLLEIEEGQPRLVQNEQLKKQPEPEGPTVRRRI
ncbi:hypothetical protein [Salmonirosea aquatica]|uniref:Uncharacterized protein n=1 Tax=Salmonirosea aquatica TaxID=2654236 RepID=A0A7C9FTV3_9BACT|nr:hypothetical protein [Cytophagaceae bacterium SJW1-29]